MSGYKVLLLLVMIVVCVAEIIPCSDEMIQPREIEDAWLLKSHENYIPFGDTWFCPSSDTSEMRTIVVYRCSTRDEAECLDKEEQIGLNIMQMTMCKDVLINRNFDDRVRKCMPWENNHLYQYHGHMTHLRKQFLSLNKLFTDKTFKDSSQQVPKCDVSTKEISFSTTACWYDDKDLLVLKPSYKFSYIANTNKKNCEMLHNAVDIVSNNIFLSSSLIHKYQSSWRAYMYCNMYNARNQDGKNVGTVSKRVQFHDYTLDTKSVACTDSVTKSCFDNAFSFTAKICRWVHESQSSGGLSLKDLLHPWPSSDKEAFFNYGAGNFVMDLTSTNIQLRISTADAASVVPWDGTAKGLALTSRLYVDEQDQYSCSGCPWYAQAPRPYAAGVRCGVPQECMTCAAWQRVVQDGTKSICDPPFELRTCEDCKQHHVRSGRGCDSVVDHNRRQKCKELVETSCEACPALAPMRRVGACVSSAYCGDAKCEECNHTQYFDKTNANGCLYFMSVVDGLTFTGGVRFNKAYVDQYKPVGSTRAPEAVPALKYRNLMQDGKKWDASSVASNCEPSMFRDFNYPGILTRNVGGQRIRYRRWCGHDEMLKDNNAELQLLTCYFLVSHNEYSLFSTYPSRIPLQDANNMQNTVIDKERVHLNNRVAEIKLTYTLNDVECHYEILREGRTDDCTYCNGTFYTKDCGPTYIAGLETPVRSGPGSCEKCDEQCVNAEHFFEASEFSCWSNGTSRVSGSVQYGSVQSIAEAMSTTRNYWYKQAVCVACKKLHKPTAASVPQIVTRCGNKLTFEVWHPTLQRTVLLVTRPRRRACCAINSIFTASGEYTSELGTRCVIEASDGTMDVAKLASGATPLCATSVPDLSTAYMPFCPPGWFFDKSVAGCGGELDTWDQKCCSLCSDCATAGSGWLKTNEYKLCSGDTAEDTQRAGCVTSCAEKNYQVGSDTCVACESCG